MLADVAREAARRFGDRPCFVAPDGRVLTYADLDTASDAVAGGLYDADGIREGDVVCLVLPSGFDYAVAYVALSKLGAIAAGINPNLTPFEREAIADRVGARLVLTTPELARGLDPGALISVVPWPESTPPDPIRPDDERIAAIVFTSGTTGEPKGAVFRERHLRAIAHIDLGDAADEWGGGGPMIASTQFAHVGFMTKLPWYLRRGTTTFLLDRWRADDVLAIVERERVTSLGVVAPQLALMLRSPRFDEFDVSSVTTIIAGAAASPPALVREARERFGAAYSIRYSSTESGGVGLGTAFDAPDSEALHTIGRPRPGVDVAIVGDDGSEVAPGEVGELLIRSPAVADGYWRDAEASAATFRDGWLHTGDLGCRLDDGSIQLRGRRSEKYVRGGYNVHPAEVEAVLGDHPALAAIAVTPRPDDVMGEIGVAVAVLRPGHPSPTLAELRDWGADRLAPWKLPEALVVVGELPLTPMQKLDRRAVASLADEPGDSDAIEGHANQSHEVRRDAG